MNSALIVATTRNTAKRIGKFKYDRKGKLKMIRVVGKRGKGSFDSQLDESAKGQEFVRIDCTSNNKDEVMNHGLSPFYLGPVECYDGLVSQTFERAWQCAKVYPWMADADGNPNAGYYAWRNEMWGRKDFSSKIEIRFPVGKENVRKCLYAWWKVDGAFRKLGYVAARKAIYMSLYAKAVVKTEAYRRLVELRDEGKNLMLIDFDGYNPYHPHYGFASDDAVRTYNAVVHCPLLKMGHGFTLAMLLEGLIRVENGEVKYADGLMDDPHRTYSPDLRKLTPEALLQRNASRCCVTEAEYAALDELTRKLLWNAAGKKSCAARGFSKAAWKRLPLAEKLALLRVRK